jgi:CBS domain containing-hemolysin-like protein
MEETWLIIVVALMFSALFSGIEIAFLSANRLQIELELKQKKWLAPVVDMFMGQGPRFIAALLVGNNIALVVYGIFMATLLEPYIEYFWPNDVFVLLVQTLLSTLVVLITAEFLPKALFRIDPNAVLNLLALPLALIYFLLFIPAYLITGLSNIILRTFFKLEDRDQDSVYNRLALYHFLLEKTSSISEDEEVETEIQIFQNALEFSKIKARECMVPRNEVEALDIEDDLQSLRQRFMDTGHSKIVIYRENIDNIIGYVHSSELFKSPDSIKSILRPIAIVPESKTANDILEQLISQRRHIAVVLDEYGGTAGILTIEDVIEELFGDIEDEHDNEEMVEVQLAEDHYRFAARQEIDYLNDQYRLDIPESDEYDTLAGFILHHFEDIPRFKQRIDIPPFRFIVTKVDRHRIEEVALLLIDR